MDYKRLIGDEQLSATQILNVLILVAMEVFPGITMIPEVSAGKPCIAETSVDVASVVGALGIGQSFGDVQEVYQLSYEQVLTALRYASYVTDHLPLRVPKGADTV